eukprot:3519661-Pyramimonas_sp.AAC.1
MAPGRARGSGVLGQHRRATGASKHSGHLSSRHEERRKPPFMDNPVTADIGARAPRSLAARPWPRSQRE